MGKSLGGFQALVAILLTGRLPRRTPDRKWKYTSTAMAREELGFLIIEEYIRQR